MYTSVWVQVCTENLQASSTAEAVVADHQREATSNGRVDSEDAASQGDNGAFNFKAYMAERAALIDAALDKSVPMQYPELVNEAMR